MNDAQTSPAHSLPPLVVACLLATWLIWGSTYLAIKWALVGYPPYYQMGTRFLVAGGILFAWMRFVRRAPLPTPRQWRNALIVGSLMLVLGMGGTAYAEQTIGSGILVAFIAVLPMVIAAVNLFFGVRPTRMEMLGILIGFGGVLLLIQGAEFRASPAGLIAIAVATCGWSTGSVLSQRATPLAPGAMGFASEMLCGAVVLLAVSALRGESPAWPPPAGATLAWIYLIVFGSFMAFNAYMVLLERTSAALASSYSFVNPIIALLLGVWLGGEHVGPRDWLAAAIVLSGVALMLWQRRLRSPAT